MPENTTETSWSPTPSKPGRLPLLIPLVTAFCFLMEQLDQTIITTAIPDIAHSFHVTPVRLNLAITSYVLSLAVFIPISGWLADRFGARNVICCAFFVFTLGSAACGMSTDLTMLVATRVLQGIGGAMMTPVGRLILFRSFRKDQLVTAMAYVSIPSLLGPTLGPLVGGAITTYWSWRWIFYVNIPVGVVAILIAGRAVENFRSGTRTSFDFTGFLLSGIGLALLQFFLETVGRGEIGAAWVAALLVGGVALMLVYRWHARRHANAVLDLSLFSIRTFRIGSLAGGLSRVAINAPPFLLPLLFQVGFGLSPVQSGLLTFVSSLGAFAVKPVSASLLRLMGFDRLLVVNSIVSAAAIAGFAAFHAGTPHWFVLAYIMTFGVVRTTQFNAVQMLSYADVPRSRLSRATSLGSVVQQLTMGLGVSVSAALLNMLAGSGQNVTAADFSNVFLVLGVLPLLAIPGFLALRPDDGVEVSRHQRARPRAAE